MELKEYKEAGELYVEIASGGMEGKLSRWGVPKILFKGLLAFCLSEAGALRDDTERSTAMDSLRVSQPASLCASG